MSIEELKIFLSAKGCDYEIISHARPIRSKKDAESYFNINETAPALILKTDEEFVAVIASGEKANIDFEPLKL